MASVRSLIYVVVFFLVAVGVAVRVERARRFAEFKKDMVRFETQKEEDGRFTNAFVSYFPDPPCVMILGYGLPPAISNDLENLVKTNFFPLPVRIYYKDETGSTNH